MVLFEETFADPEQLPHDWVVAPGMAVKNGVLTFSPGRDAGYSVGLTRHLANNPSVVWFHTFIPSANEGYRVELVPSTLVPRAGVWYRMRVVVRDAAFEVLLGEPDGPLQHCASWRNSWQTLQRGAVGVWEHGGEAGEYRALRVEDLATDEG